MPIRITKEVFLERAIALHKDQFDYSKIEYLDYRTKINIGCKLCHDWFLQSPRSHLDAKIKGNCNHTLSATPARFIRKANTVHNNEYDYSLVNYEKCGLKIDIICKEHGIFSQTVSHHLNGYGCPTCARRSAKHSTQLDTTTFVARANETHQYKYDYSKSIYTTGKEKLIVICPIHGEFCVSGSNHLYGGYGCTKCSMVDKIALLTRPKEWFLVEAKETHGDRYDYSQVNYVNITTKITILCKTHGPFIQNPAKHLEGQGCARCSKIKRDLGLTKSLEQFLEQANLKHNCKYDYSLTVYKSTNDKIIIICKDHGQFSTTPHRHLHGAGCQKCANSISPTSQLWLDSLNIPNDKDHREVSIKDIKRRFRADGFDPATNTIYEFYGDYWHGNLKVFKPHDKNLSVGKAYGDLYLETQRREILLIRAGYNLVTIWENDFKEMNNDKRQ